MNRRMIAAALACLACTAGLSACSLTGTGDTHHIAVIIKHAGEHFQNVMAGAEACAGEHPNVTIDIQFPSSTDYSAEQLDLFRSALDDDSVDAVVISPMQSGQLSAAAESADKPIIALDTDFTSDKKLSFVGTGNEAAAKKGAIAAVEAAKKAGWDEVKCIEIAGVQGDETCAARMKGYEEGVNEAGGEFLTSEVQYADATADRATTAMEAIMQTHPEGIAIICAHNDDTAMAAARAAKGHEAFKNTIFLGFNGDRAACEAILNGQMTMSVAQMAYEMGYKAVETMVQALDGETVDEFVDSGSDVVTPDNAQERLDTLKTQLH